MRENGHERYRRQLPLPEIGIEGQKRLGASSVLVLGAGGLGGPVLQYLAAAGVGRIDIMDGDTVSESNLNRQILYEIGDVGHPKALKAAQRLRRINGGIEVNAIPEMLCEETALERVSGYDALALCLDSFKARKIANRACVGQRIPFVEAGVSGFCGSVTTVIPFETPCYECICGSDFGEERGSEPILGAMAGWVGCAEALAVIRLLLGAADPLKGKLLIFDGARLSSRAIPVKRNPDCPVCKSAIQFPENR